MQKILEEIASSLQFDATKFLADFKNGDEWISDGEAAEKLHGLIVEKFKAAKDAARKQGRKEVSDKVTRVVKQSGFDNPESLEGDALVSAFLEWKDEHSAGVEGDVKGMSKEELLKLPVVKNIVSEVTAKAGEKFFAEKSEWEKKVKTAENTRKGLLLDRTLLGILEKGKVNLGETPEQKALRLDFLKSRVNLDRVEVGDGDSLKFLDESGYETDFEKDFLPIAQTAFGVITQDKNRGGSGAQGSGQGGNGHAGEKYKPVHSFPDGSKTFDALMIGAKDAVERLQVHKDWKFQQEQEAAGKQPA